MKKINYIILLVAVCSLSLFGCSQSSTDESKDVIDKLGKISSIDKSSDTYTFTSKNPSEIKWQLVYSTENEFVKFYDDRVSEIFYSITGFECFDEDEHQFIYDFGDNAMRIYFDEELIGVSFVQYDIDEDEISVRQNGEDYYASDEFLTAIEDYELIEIMQSDFESLKNELKDHDISYDVISDLEFNDID